MKWYNDINDPAAQCAVLFAIILLVGILIYEVLHFIDTGSFV